MADNPATPAPIDGILSELRILHLILRRTELSNHCPCGKCPRYAWCWNWYCCHSRVRFFNVIYSNYINIYLTRILHVPAAVFGQIALVTTAGASIGAYIAKKMAITGILPLSSLFLLPRTKFNNLNCTQIFPSWSLLSTVL